MPVLGITGGIASGKSSFVRILQTRLPGRLFDSDLCVKELLTQNQVLAEILQEFGPGVFNEEGGLDKPKLRTTVFSHSNQREKLESVLHPKVRERWLRLVTEQKRCEGWLYIDIPLLFETGAEQFFDTIVVVACQPALQRQRLMELRHIDSELAEKMIASQLDLQTRMGKAAHVVWNAGSLTCLENQTRLFAAYIQERYG